MYEAYVTEEVVSKLPFDATCIEAYNKKNKLLIGSKQGHLLCCVRSTNNKSGFEFQVSRTFEKRSIFELKVVESHNLILCLTADSQVTVHLAAEPFSLISAINKYRSITSFGHFVHKNENKLIIAIVSKKRVYIFKWFINNFEEQNTSMPLYIPDNAQRIEWCNSEALILAIRNEYFYFKVFSDQIYLDSQNEDDIGKPRSLFTAGSVEMSIIISIPEKGLFGLCRESLLVCITSKGKYACECRFSHSPIAIAYDSPYFIAVLPKGLIEIRTIEPSLLIQKIVLDGASTISTGNKGCVYIGSDRSSWMLNSLSRFFQNIKFLSEIKQFDLAVLLVRQNPAAFDSSAAIEIVRKLAFLLFSEKKFSDCFNIHFDVKTDVLLVINFLSFLIPEQFTNQILKYSSDELCLFKPLINLSDVDSKHAVFALGDYLSAKRTEYAHLLSLHYKNFREEKKKNLLSTKNLKKFEAILDLLDTVLLKCYLMTKPMLVPSLLRLPDNSCIISEAEKDLFSNSKFAELFILYERKKMHRKALELLKKESKNEGSSLYGFHTMVEYLQNLSEKNSKLVFEFAHLVFAENIDLGIEIFTKTSDGMLNRNFNHEEVYQFLLKLKQCSTAVIKYLEHLIFVLCEQRPKFHDNLVDIYLIEVKYLMKDYAYMLEDNKNFIRINDDDGELGILRKGFIKFLEYSKEYDAEKVIKKLDDYLLEEQAIVYGRLKEHDKSLCIYANILMDYDAAERHCIKYYDANDPINSKIFNQLFKSYAAPDKINLSNFKQEFSSLSRENITEALKILRKHASHIDTICALSLIPMDTPFSKVWVALEAVFEAIKNKVTETNVLASITERAVQIYSMNLNQLKMQKTIIDYNVECVICKKKIMNSAFVRLLDGSIAHFFCHKKIDSENSSNIKS